MWTLKSAWDQYVIDKSGYREENIVAIETNWKDYVANAPERSQSCPAIVRIFACLTA